MANKKKLIRDIRPFVAELISQGVTPEKAAKNGLENWKAGTSKSVVLLSEAIEYATTYKQRLQSNKGTRLIEVGDEVGSESRFALVRWFSMLIRLNQNELFGSTQPLFRINNPMDINEVSAKIEAFHTWLNDSPKLAMDSSEFRHTCFNLWSVPDTSMSIQDATFAPKTERGFRFSIAIWSLKNAVHHHEWSPFLPYGESGLSWCGELEFTLWLVFGIYPKLPLAWVTIPEKNIGRGKQVTPRKESKQLGFPSLKSFGARGITIHIFDPEGVSPDTLRSLYSDALQSGAFRTGRPFERSREVLSILELELILEQLDIIMESGTQINRKTWTWRPKAIKLLEVWKNRAVGFGQDVNAFKSHHAINNFQSRRDFEDYRVAIESEASRISPRRQVEILIP